jgi:Lanthionine synthetase C-like protein
VIAELRIVDGAYQVRAHESARTIARRCGDFDRLRERTEASGGFQRWNPRGLYGGCAGLAVFFAAMGDARRAHRLLELATAEPMAATALFDGLGSVLFAARYARRVTGHFGGLTTSLEAIAERDLRGRLEQPAPPFHYELGYGIAGELLAIGRPVDGVARYVAAFCESRSEGGWTSEAPESETERTTMLGLAHGIAGLLSAVLLTGQAVSREHVELLVSALVGAAMRHDGLVRWPRAFEETDAPGTQAWCHGAPGILVALYTASVALGDEELRRFSIDALRGHAYAGGRASHAYHAMCHGASGVALIAAVVGAHAGDGDLLAGAAAMIRDAIDALDPSLPFGYRTNGRSGPEDDWGLFGGSAGVALAMLAASGLADDAWLLAFGIPTPQLLRGIGDRWKPHRLTTHHV